MDISNYKFRPDGKAGIITVDEVIQFAEERGYSYWFRLHVLSEHNNLRYYYEKTERGQFFLQEQFIELMHSRILKS